ncbi:keratin-associated protein 4-9-like [Xenia sp. Carnegie-2017]|uniref:keratin-associated protein 4-9-like n=1 Tax=Xenia sp. Carnegie-2017 TaxID=2897299 RepID=UPI001F03F63F|nr:keratin-associated protein 4-9-like [Xenia sp. Carnegie-2017]XP_046852940.1 keratin-associated protein 4-9-like [Xenia sp. Carnegie-2017]XP_046852941.1 keratin-associated protein 4-9-like [Xenia sp. Carnegie-2017]
MVGNRSDGYIVSVVWIIFVFCHPALITCTAGENGMCLANTNYTHIQCISSQCNGTNLINCVQSCSENVCTNLTCDHTTKKCEQFCNGCKIMNCTSLVCHQQCTEGFCEKMICGKSLQCKQQCTYCRNQYCYDSRVCQQICPKTTSNCLLNCFQSEKCLQNCNGKLCQADCRSKQNCVQICNSRGSCEKLVCKSKVCRQKCDKNSNCRLLRCHGDKCKQESHEGNVTMECLSNDTCYQHCYASGCRMSCAGNVKRCHQYCYGGGCNMTCPFKVTNCHSKCPGGNCSTDSMVHITSKPLERDNREKCKNSSTFSQYSTLYLIVVYILFCSFQC